MASDPTRHTRLRALLEGEKRRLWAELREEIFRTLGEEMHTQYEIPQDIGEQGILDLLSDTGLAVADIRKGELIRLDEAIARLAAGCYGVCEECETEIDEARLKAVPYATCCVECQKRREGPAPPHPATL